MAMGLGSLDWDRQLILAIANKKPPTAMWCTALAVGLRRVRPELCWAASSVSCCIWPDLRTDCKCTHSYQNQRANSGEPCYRACLYYGPCQQFRHEYESEENALRFLHTGCVALRRLRSRRIRCKRTFKGG